MKLKHIKKFKDEYDSIIELLKQYDGSLETNGSEFRIPFDKVDEADIIIKWDIDDLRITKSYLPIEVIIYDPIFPNSLNISEFVMGIPDVTEVLIPKLINTPENIDKHGFTINPLNIVYISKDSKLGFQVLIENSTTFSLYI
jgi:hypothetical protein